MGLPKFVFLLGHRQGAGKDITCDQIEKICQENNLTFCRESFAKLLKKQVGARYGLDASKMDCQEYKLWCPHWIDPKDDGTPRSVRDILIEEGCKGRDIWENVWCWAAYKEIFKSGADVGIISDFRFPNERDSFNKLQDFFIESNNLPKDIERGECKTIQIYRPEGVFKNDGADAELPDDFEYWDYNIINKESPNYENILKSEMEIIMEDVGLIKGDKNALEDNKAKQSAV